MGSLGDGVKKVLLAGIGTAAVTAEKSKEVLDKMAERGEAAVEQGKVLNQELRHNQEDRKRKCQCFCQDIFTGRTGRAA